MYSQLRNGSTWFDTDGHVLHAHGGHIVCFDGTFYWYGENRVGANYVSCYASKDLMNWEFRNHVLTADSPVEDKNMGSDLLLRRDGRKVNIERPKVIYNEKTGKYVMWAHYENGKDYLNAAIAIATCDTPDGDFVYHGFFRPFGHMSRDCNVFEHEGKMYFVSAANDNADLRMYEMTEDYLGVEKKTNKVFIGEYREAPALFTHNGRIYLISSFCTGWRPNQVCYSSATQMEGEWEDLKKMGDETTYRTQPTWVLTLESAQGRQLIYIGDRWGGSNWNIEDRTAFQYGESNYYFSLIHVDEDGKLTLEPCDTFRLTPEEGFTIIE